MKYIYYLGRQQRGITALVAIYVLEGYDVCTPQYYNNPIPFLQSGCHIWIEISGDEYDVFEIADSVNWREDVIRYIQDNLPRIEYPICRHISTSDKAIEKYMSRSPITNLCGRLFDRDGNIISEIVALREALPAGIVEDLDDELDEFPSIKIIVKKCSQPSSLRDLMDWILSRKCLDDFQNDILWYESSADENYSKELGLSHMVNSIYTRKVMESSK